MNTSAIMAYAPMGPLRIAASTIRTALSCRLIALLVILAWEHPPHTMCEVLSGVLQSGQFEETLLCVYRLISLKFRIFPVNVRIKVLSCASVIFFAQASSRCYFEIISRSATSPLAYCVDGTVIAECCETEMLRIAWTGWTQSIWVCARWSLATFIVFLPTFRLVY